jgi:hypothetical protein
MSERDRHREREREREIALGSTPTHRETNKTTTQSTPSHGGPREGREGTWDQYTTDTIGDGIRSIPVPTQFAIERKEVQYILRIGEICLE